MPECEGGFIKIVLRASPSRDEIPRPHRCSGGSHAQELVTVPGSLWVSGATHNEANRVRPTWYVYNNSKTTAPSFPCGRDTRARGRVGKRKKNTTQTPRQQVHSLSPPAERLAAGAVMSPRFSGGSTIGGPPTPPLRESSVRLSVLISFTLFGLSLSHASVPLCGPFDVLQAHFCGLRRA